MTTTQLTQDQITQLAVYKNKWAAIGLDTTQPTDTKIRKIIDKLYRVILKTNKVPVVICDSPYQLNIALNQYYQVKSYRKMQNLVTSKHRNFSQTNTIMAEQISKLLNDQTYSGIAEMLSIFTYQFFRQRRDLNLTLSSASSCSYISEFIRNTIITPIYNSFNEIGIIVYNYMYEMPKEYPGLYMFVSDNTRYVFRSQDTRYVFCVSGSSSVIDYAICDYLINEIGGVENDLVMKFNILKELINVLCIYPSDDICFVCRKPEELHFNTKKNLHNDIGPAIKWKDNQSSYYLNGVQVPEKVVLTPIDKLSVKQIIRTKNVEVRKELLRRLGIEKLIAQLGVKPIDISADGMYELYKFKITNIPCTFLKMKNPSLDNTYHFEGVNEDCITIQSALAWRDSETVYIKPLQLT